MNDVQAKPQRLLNMKEVIDRVKLSKATIYKRISDGEFPRQISIGGKRVAWLESEIDEWIVEHVKASRLRAA